MLMEAGGRQVEYLMTLKDVKDYLGLSYGVVLGHIRDGKIRAFKVTGETVRRDDIHDGVKGLRVRQEDLDEYLENVAVK